MPKIVYLDNLPAQEGVSILENQNKIKVVKIEKGGVEQEKILSVGIYLKKQLD